jgi:hypothetical protein
MHLYRVLVRFIAGHGWVLFLLRSHLTGDFLITRGKPRESTRALEGAGRREFEMTYEQREITYEQRVAVAAKILVKIFNHSLAYYWKARDRQAECIAYMFDMDLKDVRHDIHALVKELA